MVDPDQPREPFDATEMVAMPVSRDQVVEVVASHPILDHMNDPLGIAVVKARPSRIDKYRLAVAGHKHGGRAPLNVHKVDIQPPIPGWLPRDNTIRQPRNDRDKQNYGPETLNQMRCHPIDPARRLHDQLAPITQANLIPPLRSHKRD
jgi:hypothetical protein